MEQGSQAWHEWRKQGIGASEMAAIMGLSPYSTPMKVWKEKLGLAEAFEGNFATERGSELEAKARARYELKSMNDFPPALAVHPKYEFLRASLDGISDDKKTILEIKVPGKETHENAKLGIVPDHYMIQIQMQLLVTGADECHFFTYSDKDDSDALVIVQPILDIQAMIVIEAEKFWNLVKNKIPPPLTDKDEKEFTSGFVFNLCKSLETSSDKMNKKAADEIKAQIIKEAGHPRVRCGNVLVTKSVTASGKDSYRLTIKKDEK